MRQAIAIGQTMPGPLAIQVGIYISYLRAASGAPGREDGLSFSRTSLSLLVWVLSNVHLGDLKPVTAVFYGVSPAVIALILHSCYCLGKLGMEDWFRVAKASPWRAPSCVPPVVDRRPRLTSEPAVHTTEPSGRASFNRERPESRNGMGRFACARVLQPMRIRGGGSLDSLQR